MSEEGCPKCESGLVSTEVMFAVSGEVGGIRQETQVATCVECGHRWAVK